MIFSRNFLSEMLSTGLSGIDTYRVERMGLVMEGEELLVGAYHTYPMAIGTAMGIVPMGKGSVLFSTLDIYGNIINDSAAGLVAKKLIFNMIDFK